MNIDTVTTHMKTLQPTAMPRALESGMVGGAALKKEAMTADPTVVKEKPFYDFFKPSSLCFLDWLNATDKTGKIESRRIGQPTPTKTRKLLQ